MPTYTHQSSPHSGVRRAMYTYERVGKYLLCEDDDVLHHYVAVRRGRWSGDGVEYLHDARNLAYIFDYRGSIVQYSMYISRYICRCHCASHERYATYDADGTGLDRYGDRQTEMKLMLGITTKIWH